MTGVKGFRDLVEEVKQHIKEVDTATVKAKLDKGEEFVLIDVREPNEFQASHLPKSEPVPRGMLELEIEDLTPDRKTQIVLYCGGGSRSALAAESLQRMGYTDVYSMAEGFRGWRAAGYAVET